MPRGPTKRELALHALLTEAGPSVPMSDPDTMALTALRAWAGQPRTHEEADRHMELLLTIILHGDRAADHLYYWRDDKGAEWTPNVGLYAAVYHGLPTDERGLLRPERLGAAVARAAAADRPDFRTCVRHHPSATLRLCASAATARDAEMPDLAEGESLRAWGTAVKGPDATRWRQVQSLIEGRRIPVREWA